MLFTSYNGDLFLNREDEGVCDGSLSTRRRRLGWKMDPGAATQDGRDRAATARRIGRWGWSSHIEREGVDSFTMTRGHDGARECLPSSPLRQLGRKELLNKRS